MRFERRASLPTRLQQTVSGAFLLFLCSLLTAMADPPAGDEVPADATEPEHVEAVEEYQASVDDLQRGFQDSVVRILETYRDQAVERRKLLVSKLDELRKGAMIDDDLALALRYRDLAEQFGDWVPAEPDRDDSPEQEPPADEQEATEPASDSIPLVASFHASIGTLEQQRDAAISRAAKEHRNRAQKLRGEVVERLSQSRRERMVADDLDGAVQVQQTIDEIEGTTFAFELPAGREDVDDSDAGADRVEDETQAQEAGGPCDEVVGPDENATVQWVTVINAHSSGSRVAQFEVPADAKRVWLRFHLSHLDPDVHSSIDPGHEGRCRINYKIAAARIYSYGSTVGASYGVSLTCNGRESDTKHPDSHAGAIDITKLLTIGEVARIDYKVSMRSGASVQVGFER